MAFSITGDIFMDFYASVTRPARLIAVGNRINLKAAASEETFTAELERIAGLALPHLAEDRPNLVVLGEVLGLPLALTGRRGAIPRRMHSSGIAMSMLALGYAGRIRYYRRVFSGISLVRALLLALTDTLYRPFTATLSSLPHAIRSILSASTITPHVYCSTDLTRSRVWAIGGPSASTCPLILASTIPAFSGGPDGSLLGTTDKVFLTESERTTLDLTPGDLDEVHPHETALGKVGIAISLDAFTPDYLHHLDKQGTRIILQNDANDGIWASPSQTCEWQPQEWLNSVLGSVQAEYAEPDVQCLPDAGRQFLRYHVRWSINHHDEKRPIPADPRCNFVGNNGFYHTGTGQPFTGTCSPSHRGPPMIPCK